MTRERFEEIYKESIELCRLKCQNDSVRNTISRIRQAIKNDDMKYVDDFKGYLKNRHNNEHCYYDCSCVPDIDYMYKKITEEVEK